MLTDWLEHIAANGGEPACGWPIRRWFEDDSGASVYLVYGRIVSFQMRIQADANTSCFVDLPDTVALALLRDHAREWLAERGIYIRPTREDELGLWWIEGIALGPPARVDYDRALIAACVAASKEEPSDADAT